MSSKYVDIDMSDFERFFGRVEKAARGDFRKEFELFLEAIGNCKTRLSGGKLLIPGSFWRASRKEAPGMCGA